MIIDVKHDSFHIAIAKKIGNETLSPKTLKKLTLIANQEMGWACRSLKSGEKVYLGKSAGMCGRFAEKFSGVLNPKVLELLNIYGGSKQLVQMRAARPGTNMPIESSRTFTCGGGVDSTPSPLVSILKRPAEPVPGYPGAAVAGESVRGARVSQRHVSFAEPVSAGPVRAARESNPAATGRWARGDCIARGAESKVYLSAADSSKVIKSYFSDVGMGDIQAEVQALNRYYGAGFATVSPDGRSLMMRKLEGTPLHLLQPQQKPADLFERICHTLTRMSDAGIYPDDLCEANFLYAPRSGVVYPIDLKSSSIDFNDAQDVRRYRQAYEGGVGNLRNVASRR